MKKYIKIVCLFILLSSYLYSQSEDISFEHLTINDGLPNGYIWTILQDIRGFLWFGSIDGLIRYDGYQFKIFRNVPGDSTSISNADILTLYEDKSGILWIGTDGGGLNKFNRDKENFTRYLHNPNDPKSISDNAVWSICEAISGNLWIGTWAGGLNKFNKQTEKFISYKNDIDDSTSLSFNSVLSIYEDSKNNLWIGSMGGGLNLLTPTERIKENPHFVSFRHDPGNSKSISTDQVFRVFEDKNGILWIGTLSGGLNRLIWEDINKSQASFFHYKNIADDPASLSGNEIVQIYQDKSDDLWIGTWGGGLNKLIPAVNTNSRSTFKSYKQDSDDPSSFGTNIIYTIYEDNSGLLWVGSFGIGLYKYNKKKKPFLHYQHNPNNPSSLSADAVYAIFEDRNGFIWIGTWDSGLNKFDRKTNKFKHYRHNPDDPSSIGDDGIYSIYEDKSGMIWIGTFNGGLNMLNPVTEKFTRYQHNPKDQTSISSNMVMDLCEDIEEMMWIGTFDGGLNKFDKKTGKFIHYRHDPDDSTSLSSDRVELVYFDKQAVIWAGTHGGLNKYDSENDNFIYYKHDPNDPTSICYDNISCIYEDNAGGFWIGTVGGGLSKYNRDSGKFSNYKVNDGLPNDGIWGILEDDHGNLWLSTGYGLSKFNPLTETFRNYDVRDGLQSNIFEQYSFCKSRTGEMLFGGPNGLNIFYPDSIKDNRHIPPVYLTNFLLYNEPVMIGFDSTSNRTILKKSIIEADQIELTYEDKVISFEFAALDFHVPEKNKYAYILEGFESEWNYTNADRRFATYTNLNPGEYTFKVKGSNNDGIWNENGASIRIIILPPWWATTWAYIFYGFLIVSIIYSTWKLQLKRIRNKHELEMTKFEAEKMHEVDEIKSRFFANISHEFRTPLTLIFGPTQDIMDETSESKTKKKAGIIKRNASKLYGLVNQLLDISKLEACKMKLEASEQNIIPILKELFRSFSSFAERKKITFKFNSTVDNLNVYIDRDKLEKVISNLLSNALKFTPDEGRVDFNVEELPDKIKLNIKDNGIGIPEERMDKIFDRFYQVDGSHTRESEGTGIGLALTKELVELHKGRIKVESREGQGTIFTVILPLGGEHLKPEEISKAEQEYENVTDGKPGQEMKKELSLAEDLIIETGNNKRESDLDLLIDSGKDLVLIVEDNLNVRQYIIEHLEEGYRILEAVDGENGLDEAIKHIPDLIVSDIMMPKMDGFEMCNKIKNDERTSHIPVILLTAKAADRDKIFGYELGADDYIMKPFDLKVLEVRIKNLIETRRKLQEKFSSDNFVIPKELSPIDVQFLKRTLSVIEDHIADENFNIEILSRESAMSREQMYKKVKALTGKSPVHFLRSIRLTKAKNMIKEQKGNISEISFSVGFSSPAYFTKCFKEEFGYSPSELITK